MERQKTIVDASVIVKWFTNEESSEEALKLRDEHLAGRVLLSAPHLLFLEVLNALRYKNKSEKDLANVNRALWDMQLHIEDTNFFLLDKASSLAVKHNLSLYDAIYFALSVLSRSPLITADEKLAKVSKF